MEGHPSLLRRQSAAARCDCTPHRSPTGRSGRLGSTKRTSSLAGSKGPHSHPDRPASTGHRRILTRPPLILYKAAAKPPSALRRTPHSQTARHSPSKGIAVTMNHGHEPCRERNPAGLGHQRVASVARADSALLPHMAPEGFQATRTAVMTYCAPCSASRSTRTIGPSPPGNPVTAATRYRRTDSAARCSPRPIG